MTRHVPIPTMQLSYGVVVSVERSDLSYEVQVRLHGYPSDEAIWARVLAPVAGDGYGAVMLPNVDDEVLVGFVGGDPAFPVVMGSLYTANNLPPFDPIEGSQVRRWGLQGEEGTRVTLDESQNSEVVIETASTGVKITVSDQGRKIEATNGSSTVTISPSGVKVETGATVTVEASHVDVNAPAVNVNAAMSNFSGVVMCDVLQTNTVISTTYTPGAGNVW